MAIANYESPFRPDQLQSQNGYRCRNEQKIQLKQVSISPTIATLQQ